MADEKKEGGVSDKTPAGNPKVGFEAGFADDRATTGSFGEGGEGKAKQESHRDRSNIAEFGADGKQVEKPDADEGKTEGEEDDLPPVDGEETPDADANDKGDDEGGSPDADAEAKPLPAEVDPGEWDSAKPEVVEAFDKKYWDEEGKTLNLQAFNATLEANIALGNKPDIAPGERAYLKDRLGLSDEAISQHIAGVVLAAKANDDAFYALPFVGSKEAHEARIEWGKTGYTPAQKAAFKAAMDKGGEEAKEALEMLDMRFTKAGGKLPSVKGGEKKQTVPPVSLKGPPGRRDASPKKDATAGASTPAGKPGVEPFKSAEEHRKAQAEAMKSGDKAKIEEVRKRLVASPALWKA